MKYLRLKASEWHKNYFKGTTNPPSLQSIKKWIDVGKLAGRKLGTMHFVFCDKDHEPLELHDMPNFLQSKPTKKSEKINTTTKVNTGNNIADQIIKQKLNHVTQK